MLMATAAASCLLQLNWRYRFDNSCLGQQNFSVVRRFLFLLLLLPADRRLAGPAAYDVDPP